MWLLTLLVVSGCAFEFSERETRPHGEVGAEVFRLVCMNLAAQAFPNDLTGERFSGRCDGKVRGDETDPTPQGDDAQRAYLRYRALVERRDELVKALDAAFDEDAYRPDGLRTFLAEMVPLYDPPEQLPEVTRAAAALLTQLIDPNDAEGAAAIAALERMSTRDGYRPARHGLAITRALLTYPKFDEIIRTTLASIAPDTGPAREQYEALLRAATMDLATADSEVPDPKNPGTLTTSLPLLFSQDAAFGGTGAPAFLPLRDPRGLARPKLKDGGMAAPFQDRDGDGLADVDEHGRFVLSSSVSTPYATFESIADDEPRDEFGRATDRHGEPLYESVDVNQTLLAGLLRDLGPLLEQKGDDRPALLEWLYGANALVGEYGQRTQKYGDTSFAFQGPNTSQGPMFDLVHAIASLLPFEEIDPFLEVVARLFRDHERELAGLIEAVLYIKERSDAYSDAVWEKPHDLWDDMLAWTVKAAEKPGLLEAMLRAAGTEEFAGLGPVVGNFMRFKDRVNWPLGKKEELKALGIWPEDVLDKVFTDCTGAGCGKPCDLNTACPDGLACVIRPCPEGQVCTLEDYQNVRGVCGSVAQAVQAHRRAINHPCLPPPDDLFAGDPGADCTPQVPYPSPHHRGIRNCPAEKPEDGASCADVGGFGLCSWDQGSCTCDCDGGLCRNGASPTWRCTDQPTPGYAEWVDRSQPDHRGVDADDERNQSLFQRTLALVHDLHIPNKMCTKAGSQIVFYTPGTNDLLLGDALTRLLTPLLPALGPYEEECEMLEEEHIVRYYLRGVLGYGKASLSPQALNGLLNFLQEFGRLIGLPAVNETIIERQFQVRGFNLDTATPQSIARFVWSPLNPFQQKMFNTVKTRDGFSLVELHQDTIPAWELPDPISGYSINTGVVPLLKALDPNGAADDGYIDLLGDFYSIVHKYWASRDSNAAVRDCDEGTPLNCNESTPLFAYKANGVSYEELIAESLLDAKLLDRVRDLVLALESIKLDDGTDGLSILTTGIKNLLLPQNSCVAGDCENYPLTYRDGRRDAATNTGKVVPGVSPVYLLLDSLNAIDARFEESGYAERLKPWRAARSKIVDVFFDVERPEADQWRFKNPRARPLVQAAVDFVRERVNAYRAQEAACIDQGGTVEQCQQVRDWALGLTGRLAASLGQPVSAATMRLLDRLRDVDGDPAGKLAALMAYLTREGAPGDNRFEATAVGVADLIQVLQDTQNLGPLMRFVSRAIADNASEVAAGKASELDVRNGTLEKAIGLMRSLQDLVPETDTERSTFATLLSRLVEPHGANQESPLDVILDAVVAINRAAPGTRNAPLDVEDLRFLLRETEQFLSSKRHGLERLYDVVRSREIP